MPPRTDGRDDTLVDAALNATDLLLLSLDRESRAASHENALVERYRSTIDFDPGSRAVPDAGRIESVIRVRVVETSWT